MSQSERNTLSSGITKLKGSKSSYVKHIHEDDVKPIDPTSYGTLHFGIKYPFEEINELKLNRTKKDYVWYTQANLHIRRAKDLDTNKNKHFFQLSDFTSKDKVLQWAEKAIEGISNDIPTDFDGNILLDNESIAPIGEYWGRWAATNGQDTLSEKEIEEWDKKSIPALQGFMWSLQMTFPNAKIAWYHIPRAMFYNKNSINNSETIPNTHDKLKRVVGMQDYVDAHSYHREPNGFMQDKKNQLSYHVSNMKMYKNFADDLGLPCIASFWLSGSGPEGLWDFETVKLWFTSVIRSGIRDAAVLSGDKGFDRAAKALGISVSDLWNQRVVAPAEAAGFFRSI